MNYQQGLEDGKKSQKPIWIISGLISILGLIPIILSYLDFFKWGIFKIYSNSPKTKNINPTSLKELVNQESYQVGLKKGKLKVRLKYWLIGFGVFVVTTSINPDINPLKMLGLKKQSEKNETNSSLLPKPKSITTVKKTKLLSLMDCVEIMENHCKGSNQQLIKYFESEFDGKIIYMFFTLSYSTPGYSCVSLMTPLGEDILSVDCKTNEVKVMEWNSIPGSPKI